MQTLSPAPPTPNAFNTPRICIDKMPRCFVCTSAHRSLQSTDLGRSAYLSQPQFLLSRTEGACEDATGASMLSI